MNGNRYLWVSDEVRAALAENAPVVALESTIISHGMPYPKNVETARKVEQAVRDAGATPATIAVLGGKLCVGISEEQIDYLGRLGAKAHKVSRRDLPVLLSRGEDGATTVAATMIAAALAGISVFATGGVGGVHRGAEQTMDISADLEELAVTPVCVVCAGCKSILDLKLTMEYLETKGVPVLGYQTEDLPAFYTRVSGLKVDYRVDSAREIAEAFDIKRACALGGGMLVANPIPEAYSMDADYIARNIEEAIDECERLGIKGKATTPFLLDKVQKLTGGLSLEANIELVLNNARLAAGIATELSKL